MTSITAAKSPPRSASTACQSSIWIEIVMASRRRLVLLGIVVLIGACNAPHVIFAEVADDETPVVVLENYSPDVVLAAHYLLGEGRAVRSFEVLTVPVGGRVSVNAAFDADTLSQRVVLMDRDCALLVMEPTSIAHQPGNTLITVDPDLAVRVRGVDNLDAGLPPVTTETCLDAAERVEFGP